MLSQLSTLSTLGAIATTGETESFLTDVVSEDDDATDYLLEDGTSGRAVREDG